MDCPLCEDKFVSSKEYDIHIQEHLDKIKGIDIDCLRNGHETFECSMCDFQSNDSQSVKNHLACHVLKSNASKQERKELILKVGNWRDLYDDDGNPMYDSTDSDSSSHDEE